MYFFKFLHNLWKIFIVLCKLYRTNRSNSIKKMNWYCFFFLIYTQFLLYICILAWNELICRPIVIYCSRAELLEKFIHLTTPNIDRFASMFYSWFTTELGSRMWRNLQPVYYDSDVHVVAGIAFLWHCWTMENNEIRP